MQRRDFMGVCAFTTVFPLDAMDTAIIPSKNRLTIDLSKILSEAVESIKTINHINLFNFPKRKKQYAISIVDKYVVELFNTEELLSVPKKDRLNFCRLLLKKIDPFITTEFDDKVATIIQSKIRKGIEDSGFLSILFIMLHAGHEA